MIFIKDTSAPLWWLGTAARSMGKSTSGSEDQGPILCRGHGIFSFALGKCLSPYHPHARIQTSPLPAGMNGKALDGKYEKLFGHPEGDRQQLCRRADQSQKTAYPLGLVATKTASAALSCYLQSHAWFSSVRHTCGLQWCSTFPSRKGGHLQ